jgi:D-3-phosphoglycerate dehydrogenase
VKEQDQAVLIWTLDDEGSGFSRGGGLEVEVKPGLGADALKAIIGDYNGLVVRSATKVTADLLEAATGLEVIGRAGIGVDNVDVEAASRHGVIVMNTPEGSAVTTAEHAIALLLSLARRIPQATSSMKAGKWDKKRFMGTEMAGKTLGIIGIGNIGGIVADRARGLRMSVVACDPYMSAEVAEHRGITLVGLDELYATADFISINTPLTKDTRHMVDASPSRR